MATTESSSGEARAETLIVRMIDARSERDRRMSEEGSRGLHHEFLRAESGMLPDPTVRLECARGVGPGVAAPPGRSPRGLRGRRTRGPSRRMGCWLVGSDERREALQSDEEVRSEQRGRTVAPIDDRGEVELCALGCLPAERVGSVCRPGGENAPVFARHVTEWRLGPMLRGRELVGQAVARTTPDGLSGAEQATQLWECAPEVARAPEAALRGARVQFLTDAAAASVVSPGPPQPDGAAPPPPA